MPVHPPVPRDLPLNALRAFEAAARLGGFAAAAVELGVSAGAVTAHVRTLEAALGAPLFERSARGVRLSPAGARCLPQLTAAFDALAGVTRDLREEAAPQVVHLAALPALAQLWLSPRLPALRMAMPGVTISITAMEVPPNLKRAPYDLCLFHGDAAGVPEGASMAADQVFPVCAPSLLPRLRDLADLAVLPCLSDAFWRDDWSIWLAAVAPQARIVPRGPVYSLYALAVEEAVNGAGVLMAHGALVARHLADGRLVAPFAQRVALPHPLCLWSARPLRRGGAADRVARFLRDQAKAA